MFTKQHFDKLADIAALIDDEDNRNAVANSMVEMFRADNPRFQPERFLDAVWDRYRARVEGPRPR